MNSRDKHVAWRTLIVVVVLSVSVLALAKGPKLKPEELVARHLEAVGTEEARAALKTRGCQGSVAFSIKLGGAGNLAGPATFFSDGRNVALQMEFNDHQYPDEKFRYDTKQSYVGVVRPGLRSMLGAFVHQYSLMLTEGLLGGVLSTAWPLLKMDERRPRLKSEGLKKFGEQELLSLRYKARKGHGDLTVRLYFDPETYRHVATSYKLVINPTMGSTPQSSARTDANRYHLEEWFSDFQEQDGLTLPMQWSLKFSSTAPGTSVLASWDMSYESCSDNIPIDPASFVIERP